MRMEALSPMYETHKTCLLCGSDKIRSPGQEFERAFLVKCDSCGLAFSRRIPTPEELRENYSSYPRNNVISPVTIKRYEELLDRFEAKRKMNRLLDVGCGDGHFLEAAQKRGWEVYGTEFTANAVELCRSKKIQMHQGTIQDYPAGISFDVITSFEVIEHLNNGRDHVKKIAELLRAGGLFYFTTPNYNSLSRRLLGGKWTALGYPDHLTYYSPSTITRLLNGVGLEREALEVTGFSRERFVSSKGPAAGIEGSDEALRRAVESKAHLRLAKNLMNRVLTLFGLGDSLKGRFVKRA